MSEASARAVAPLPPGKRGQGRKQGAATRLTRVRANEIASSGHAPLDVMIENMVFWRGQSTQLAETLEKLAKSADMTNPDERRDILKLIGQFLTARQNAQLCAVDAAPYVHPRLQAIAFQGKIDHTVKQVTEGMSPQEAAEAYASTFGR